LKLITTSLWKKEWATQTWNMQSDLLATNNKSFEK